MYLEFVTDKVGFEIGGPSPIFSQRGLVPVYPFARRVDNSNFASMTIWEGNIDHDEFRYGKQRLGRQYIREASNLFGIAEQTYDFIISSQMIQHSANPLRVLYEWSRVLRDKGHLLLIVPHMKMTFDHRRGVTNIHHLIDDFTNGTGEEDMTHLEEILRCHDLTRDRLAGTFQEFKNRSEQNPALRALHQHAFDEKLVIQMINHVGLQVIHIELVFPCYILVIAQKRPLSELNNSAFLADDFMLHFYAPNIFQSKMT
jgi:SAM-dependent methyltransferase